MQSTGKRIIRRITPEMIDVSEELCGFLRKAVSPFHAVELIKEKLTHAGFVSLHAGESNDVSTRVQRGGKYWLTRNGSCLAALIVGKKYEPKNGANIIVAHTDSPALILKPKNAVTSNAMKMCRVQCYGGGLWHTWLDRDLSLAGRVVLHESSKANSETETNQKDSQKFALYSHLVNLKRPIANIPNLAIHLRSADEREKLTINKETHLCAMISNGSCQEKFSEELNFHDEVSQEIIKETGKSSDNYEIIDHELYFYDVNPPTIGGLQKEFVHSGRLDNLASCFAVVKGFLDEINSLEESDRVHIIALYDNEEVGSCSFSGAAGPLLNEMISRSIEVESIGETNMNRAHTKDSFVKNSFCISADCAHAVHPNYSEKHDSKHSPRINGGIVLKYNASVKYATQSLSGAMMKKLAILSGVPIQEFAGRNDMPCGSTIGPIVSAQTGIETADLGVPLLAMHSIRETCGVADMYDSVKFFKEFFHSWHNIKDSLVHYCQ